MKQVFVDTGGFLALLVQDHPSHQLCFPGAWGEARTDRKGRAAQRQRSRQSIVQCERGDSNPSEPRGPTQSITPVTSSAFQVRGARRGQTGKVGRRSDSGAANRSCSAKGGT